MGVWGPDIFQNDTACDWILQIEDAIDLSVIEKTISAVLVAPGGALHAGMGCEALAACDTLARLKGNVGQQDVYTSELDDWVRAHPLTPSPDLVGRAVKAIDRVISPESELRQEWDEAEAEEWPAACLAAVESLRQRLTDSGRTAPHPPGSQMIDNPHYDDLRRFPVAMLLRELQSRSLAMVAALWLENGHPEQDIVLHCGARRAHLLAVIGLGGLAEHNAREWAGEHLGITRTQSHKDDE